MGIRPTAHPTYDSCLFLYYLRVRLVIKTISGPSAKARMGYGAERRG